MNLNSLTSEGIEKQLRRFFVNSFLFVQKNNGDIIISIGHNGKKSNVIYSERMLAEMDMYYYFNDYSFCMHAMDDISRKIKEMQ